MPSNADQGPTSGLTPHLVIQDGRAAEAIDWYGRAFAAEPAMEPMLAEDGARIMHSHLRLNGASLMLNDDFPEYREQMPGYGGVEPGGVTLHLQVDDADRWFDRATDAGAEVMMPLADMFWGDRYGQLKDPFGHRWSIGGPVKGGEA